MDTKQTGFGKSLERDVLKRKKMAALRTGKVKKAPLESEGGIEQRALWHARCIDRGIGPRTRRLVSGEWCKRRWRDHNRSLKGDCWKWQFAAVSIASNRQVS